MEAFRAIADGFVTVCGRMPSRVEFVGPAGPVRIWFLSADNPDSIRGFGFQGIVIDEAASIPADVWHYVLRPTISQTLGWAVFVSTPKGRNWFHDLFTRGMDPTEKDYASFRFPSKASPYFPAQEWEEARRTLPADVFRQEYEAEFLDDSAGVFSGIEGCLFDPSSVGSEQLAVGRRNVVIGCDIAKHTDWTVLIAMDATSGRCFDMERFNHLEWPIQKERILSFARKHRGRVILDATGIGDPIYDDLKRVWPDIEGFRLSAGSKTELIQRLIVAVEQRRICWPCVAPTAQAPGAMQGKPGGGGQWDALTNELRRYEYAIGPSGHISYSAPSGYHDDCVMALALANHGRWETEGVGRMMAMSGMSRQGRVSMARRMRAVVG